MTAVGADGERLDTEITWQVTANTNSCARFSRCFTQNPVTDHRRYPSTGCSILERCPLRSM